MRTTSIIAAVFVVLLALVIAVPTPRAVAGCPVEAEKDKQRAMKEVKTLKQMLAALGDDDSGGLAEVELTEPGTVTEIAPGTGGLSEPRAWTTVEKARFDKARVNKNLPAPAGVW
jgi:hypothetical protein